MMENTQQDDQKDDLYDMKMDHVIYAGHLCKALYEEDIPPHVLSSRIHHVHKLKEEESLASKWAIYVHESTAFIVFCSEMINMDTIVNFSEHTKSVNDNNDDVRVHEEYWNEMNLSYDNIIKELLVLLRNNESNDTKIEKIVTTGHSKGGGLSQLFMYRLLSDESPELGEFRTIDKLCTISFGAPMVFSCEKKEMLSELDNRIHSFILSSDPVPLVPTVLRAKVTNADFDFPLMKSYNDQLLQKYSEVDQQQSFSYVPVGSIHCGNLFGMNLTDTDVFIGNEELFKKTSRDSFMDRASSEQQIDLGHHDMLTYLLLVDNLLGSVESYTAAAENGDPSAQWHVANCHHHDKETTDNNQESFEWYLKSADGNHQQAQLKVALFYGFGMRNVEANSEKAAEYFDLARKHSITTEFLPGFVHWCHYKAEQDGEVAATLGKHYERGRFGLPRSFPMAVKMYQLGADKGNGTAQALLGKCYERGRGGLPRDEVESVKLYRLSADQNNALGQAFLGRCFQLGLGGLEQNDKEAVRLFTLSTEQGNGTGQACLGRCYEYGRGDLEKSKDKSVEYYRQSADQGNGVGLAYLGRCYERGRGVEINEEVAVNLYMLSAEQGNGTGQAYLGSCYESGLGGLEENKSEAVRLYKLSSDQNNSIGQVCLGQCYELGVGGLLKSHDKAKELYELSVAQGNKIGEACLKTLNFEIGLSSK